MIHHVLLALSATGLVAAGLRAASRATPRGLERALAAIALAAAAAVLEALLLGLVGLGGSAITLALAALATWLAACQWLPAPSPGPVGELVSWWGGLPPRERLGLGAAVGAFAAWVAWLLRYPALGYDTVLYHLPEAVAWVQRGSPGSVEPVMSFLPVGNYPVAYEVLTAWSIGLSRSFVPASLLVAGFVALAALAGWTGLRALQVPRVASALTIGALVLSPAAIATGRSGAAVDPAALAWLATCGALCAASLRRPGLLAPAVVAAGLAAGTKTTALPLTALVLALTLYAGRRHLSRLARPLLAAAAAAIVVGAFWYLRNLVDHGSPFWPYLSLPWGDPKPAAVQNGGFSFLDRPGETLSRLDGYYLDRFAGGLVLLGGALLAPLLARRREVTAAAGATAFSLLLWLNAPMTGVSGNPGFDAGTGDSVRYLLPGLAAAALTLALAARAGGVARPPALAALGLALALNLVQSLDLGFPSAPSALTPLAGAAVGVLLAAASGRLRGAPRERAGGARPASGLRAAAAGAGAAVVAGALLAVLAPGYPQRHADTGQFDSGLVRYFEARDDSGPVASTGTLHALLAGDGLERRIELIPPREPCSAVERRRQVGSVVFAELLRQRIGADVRDCFGTERPAYEDDAYRVFAPRVR